MTTRERIESENVPGEVAQCWYCRHLAVGAGWRCAAFPEGVPRVIVENAHDHRIEYPGDRGVRFEAKEGTEELAADNWRRAKSTDVPPPPK